MGPRHFVEWQPIGSSRWLVHEHVAEIYPSQVLIQSLIHADDAQVKLSREEWNARRLKRKEPEQENAVGTISKTTEDPCSPGRNGPGIVDDVWHFSTCGSLDYSAFRR